MNRPVNAPESALVFVLKSLIPYSRQNMMLTFQPSSFFKELDKISQHKRKTLENAYYAAQRRKLIIRDNNIVRITTEGQRVIMPYIAEKIAKDASLMIIFDIPEEMSHVRARLRRVLKEWSFEQVQKSVWLTPYDHKESLRQLVEELEINEHVRIYECSPV